MISWAGAVTMSPVTARGMSAFKARSLLPALTFLSTQSTVIKVKQEFRVRQKTEANVNRVARAASEES